MRAKRDSVNRLVWQDHWICRECGADLHGDNHAGPGWCGKCREAYRQRSRPLIQALVKGLMPNAPVVGRERSERTHQQEFRQ